MKFYYSDSQIPELASLVPPQRRLVRHGAARMLDKERPFARLVVALPGGLGGAMGLVVGFALSYILPTDYWMIVRIVCGMIGAGTGGLVGGSMLTERLRPYFSRFIEEHRDQVTQLAYPPSGPNAAPPRRSL